MTFRTSFHKFLLSWAAACVATGSACADGPIRKLTLDEQAEVVPLFQGLEQGILSARVVVKDEFSGFLFIENQSQQPKTVAIPEAVAAVHVLKQFQPPGGIGLFDSNSQQGSAQSVGGQPVGMGQGFPTGGPGAQFPGNNFFSIPPEKVVQLKLESVCLEHGKPTPTAAMTYVLRKLEDHTPDSELHQLLRDFTSDKDDRMAVQAAAWHLADGTTWKELQAKQQRRLGGVGEQPYFTSRQIEIARKLAESAEKNAGDANRAKQRL